MRLILFFTLFFVSCSIKDKFTNNAIKEEQPATASFSKIDINKGSVVFSFNKNKSVLFKKYFDRLIENLRLASVGHSFKRGNHGSLCVEVPVGLDVVPIEAAFMCADYFIYNKKNV